MLNKYVLDTNDLDNERRNHKNMFCYFIFLCSDWKYL